MLPIKIFIKEELKLVNKKMNQKKGNTEIKEILEKELQLWKEELVNKIKLIEPDASKIFGKNKDNINGNKFDLDFDVSTLNQNWPMEPLIAVAIYQIHQSIETSDLVTFTEEILNGKLQFLCSVADQFYQHLRLVKNKIKGEPQGKSR